MILQFLSMTVFEPFILLFRDEMILLVYDLCNYFNCDGDLL